MRYQVPQFIEVEDKIFGPLTFKQFIYLAGSGGICVIIFIFLPMFLAVLLSIPVAALGLALAFYKVNDKPFIFLLEAFFNYQLTSKLYIWKKTDREVTRSKEQEAGRGQIQQVQVPKLSESKLKELTWSLDIKENQNPVTRDNEQSTNNNIQ